MQTWQNSLRIKINVWRMRQYRRSRAGHHAAKNEFREAHVFTSTDEPRRLAHFGRGGAISPAERAVEVGEVAEPGLEGDGRNGPPAVQRVGQHPTRTDKSLPKNKFRKSCAFAIEQQLHVARRNALLRGDGAH